LVRQVFTNKDGSTGERYLVSNDLDLGSAGFMAVYKKRWSVEEYHYAKHIVMQSGTRSHYGNHVFPWATLQYHFA